MKNRVFGSLMLLSAAVLAPLPAMGDEATSSGEDCTPRYTFSWQMNECNPAPRGGTSTGAPVTLIEGATETWKKLREPELSKRERDRRAILAMAGGYRTSFEFIETQTFPPDYEPARPYQSWGTEYVYVVANEEDFISLQHIMVMYYKEDGETRGPMVMKHWRQDWRYEDTDILQYRGNNVWRTRELAPEDVEGTWSQTVYHVDDSPRYASYGRWEHNASFSQWESQRTWRPLPRRESSVRDDYDVLQGTNRHIITPTGWLHEQDNRKLRLKAPGEPAEKPYLAGEEGLNRYQPVREFDFSAGDAYREETGPFWAEVRKQWQRIIESHGHFRVKPEHKDTQLFQTMFGLARAFRREEISLDEAREVIRQRLRKHVINI